MRATASLLAAACALACAAGGLRAARSGAGARGAHGATWSALAADLAMARAQVYFGGALEARAAARRTTRNPDRVPHLPRGAAAAEPPSPDAVLSQYLDQVVDMDPSARDRYLRGAAMLIYSAPVITPEAVLAADRLLERGTRAFPDDGALWFQIGFDRLYELPRLVDADDPRRAGWRREGVAAMEHAARLEGAPPWLGALVAAERAREPR